MSTPRSGQPQTPATGGGRRLVWLAGLLALGALGGLGNAALAHWEGPAFETLAVRGEQRQLSAQDLRDVVADHLRDGYFGADLDAIRHELEARAWIARAEVRRRWPATLELVVEEQQPVAVWNREGFLNREAELFVPRQIHEDPGPLPELIGPEDSEEELLEQLGHVARSLAEVGLEPRQLRLSERRAWSVVLADGTEIRLGRDDLDRRLERFVEIVVPALGESLAGKRYVDLRYTNGFAVAGEAGHNPMDEEERSDG